MYGQTQRGAPVVILSDDWDNESSYGECSYMSCSESEGLVRRVLFWIKLALIKVAHSYIAFPVVLFTLPLLIGLLFGYFLGKRHQKRISSQYSSRGTIWTLWLVIESLLYCMGASFKKGATSETKAVSSTIDHTSVNDSESTGILTDIPGIAQREDDTRKTLLENEGVIDVQITTEALPRHVAVVMDGNRRYGREKYGNTTAGHWDGCRKLLDMATWCQSLRIPVLTVYAFSTENWNRSEAEVSALFAIFCRYADELRAESIKRKFAVKVLSTDFRHRIPYGAQQALKRLEDETRCFMEDGDLQINVCLSYGSRGEIVNACRSLAQKCKDFACEPEQYITEASVSKEMLTDSDPDLLIRTSGEVRLSNFLLWQLAYTELFFVNKMWPDFGKDDFIGILQNYAKGRQRRYGK